MMAYWIHNHFLGNQHKHLTSSILSLTKRSDTLAAFTDKSLCVFWEFLGVAIYVRYSVFLEEMVFSLLDTE